MALPSTFWLSVWVLLCVPDAAARATQISTQFWRPGLEGHPKPTNLIEASELHRRATRVASKLVRNAPVTRGTAWCVASRDLNRDVNPVDFGADPTGRADASDSIDQALAVLVNVSAVAPHKMASNINNLGGAALDLSGGEFLISRPIIIPPLVGNVRITGGTLRATQSFPADRYLIEVGYATTPCVPADKQGVCNEFIAIHDVFLDGGHRAAGCIQVNKTMGTTIGPSAFLTGFNQAGIAVNQGHETIISDSWLAENYWSDPKPSRACTPDGSGNDGSTAVKLNGEDNYMSNVIIFDYTCLGVLVNGAATTLDGVHSWNGGGVAISIDGSYDVQDRIVNCYLDYSTLQITNPKFVLVQGNFFYNSHAVLVGAKLEGLVMKQNIYSMNQYGGNRSIVLQSLSVPTCKDVVIMEDIDGQQTGGTHTIYRTSIQQSLYHWQSKKWQFDFSNALLLPHIDTVTYSLTLDEGSALVAHAARTPNGTTVIVETAQAVSGTVTMTVSQC